MSLSSSMSSYRLLRSMSSPIGSWIRSSSIRLGGLGGFHVSAAAPPPPAAAAIRKGWVEIKSLIGGSSACSFPPSARPLLFPSSPLRCVLPRAIHGSASAAASLPPDVAATAAAACTPMLAVKKRRIFGTKTVIFGTGALVFYAIKKSGFVDRKLVAKLFGVDDLKVRKTGLWEEEEDPEKYFECMRKHVKRRYAELEREYRRGR